MWPENLPITKEWYESGCEICPCNVLETYLQCNVLEESKKQDQIRKQREEEARKQKEQEKMLSERRTIEEKKKSLNEAEKEVVNDIDVANELSS